MTSVTINGFETTLVDVGSGPNVLVTHGGWIGDWELWKRQTEIMADRGWRVIAYDHRGSGTSTAPVDAIGVDEMVDDLFAVLDQCGIERCVLGGESIGSIVVERAALRAPDRFSHLVIVSGAARFPKTPPFRAFGVGLRHAYKATLESFIWMCLVERDAGKPLRDWGRTMLGRSSPEAARKIFDEFAGIDQRDLARQITVPTLVIHGMADLIMPVPFGRELGRLIPGAKTVLLPWVGHVPTVTRAERVCDEIEQFVTAQS